MHIEPLTLSHQELLREKLFQLQVRLSEYSFASLYLFRELHRYEVLKDNEEIFIRGMTRDQVPFIMLTSPPSRLPLSLLQQALSHAQVLFPIPDVWMPMLERFLKQASFKEDDSDYLFATSKLANYPGRHLSKKRNLVKQLLHAHAIQTEELTQEGFAQAQQVLEQWQQEQSMRREETDYNACQEAIQHFEKLHLHGRLVYADALPVGFTLGEWITTDCYVVHFSKALRSMKGLYQYLYLDLAHHVDDFARPSLVEPLESSRGCDMSLGGCIELILPRDIRNPGSFQAV